MNVTAGRLYAPALIAAATLAGLSLQEARTRPPSPGAVTAAQATDKPSPTRPRSAPIADESALIAGRGMRDGVGDARERLRSLDPGSPAAEVERWIVRLAASKSGRSETAAALARFEVYEPLIRQALHDADLPQDLAFVPLIESSYRPEATSHAGAAGLWQFVPGTARAYGLEVSDWVDERRDPVRSTAAAVRHLSDLYHDFGAWHLALAAYNAGGGRVGRALPTKRTHGDGGYWAIRRRLSRETQEYVPKLLAAARIGRNPEEFGFARAGTPPLHYREVRITGTATLGEVAGRLNLDAEEVRRLNPQLVRGAVPPGRTWPVRIPVTPPTGETPLQ